MFTEDLVVAILTDALMQVIPEDGLRVSKEGVQAGANPGEDVIQVDAEESAYSYVVRKVKMADVEKRRYQERADAEADAKLIGHDQDARDAREHELEVAEEIVRMQDEATR